MLRTLLLVIVVLLLIGSLPTWGHSSGWGYYPSGGLGLLLLYCCDPCTREEDLNLASAD
jgi:hypothetical protein